MRTATTVEMSGAGWDIVEFVVEAEKLGLDVCWVAEAWGTDAPSVLGYLAARTDRMLLGSGVVQVGTRSPVVVAQTAITLSNLSSGRFLLGLGASGPQVIEGAGTARRLARCRREYRAAVPGGGHVGCQAGHPAPGHRAGREVQYTFVGASDVFTSSTSGRAGTPSARNHRKARLPRG
jgi:Luciferase-like monooxygenase